MVGNGFFNGLFYINYHQIVLIFLIDRDMYLFHQGQNIIGFLPILRSLNFSEFMFFLLESEKLRY